MDNKLSDNEIIKALELFKSIDDNDITTSSFKTKLLKEIYFLINRLKAKNKEFDEKIVMQMGTIDWQAKEINSLKAENKE